MRKLFFIVLFATLLGSAYGANPFFAGKKNEPATKLESFSKSKPFLLVLRVQRDLNKKIALASKEVHENWWKLFPLVCLVFAYGVFHALGPGHGKLFSVFYFMSEEVSLRRGILLSLMIGLLHGLMGVLLVLVLKYLLQIYSYLLQQNVSQVIQKTSYFLISLLGLYFMAKKFLQRGASATHQTDQKSGIALALSVSIVPCPGVVMIMLFCISMNALPLGLILSAFMSLGMGITIASIGLATLFLKNFSLGWAEKKAVFKIRILVEYLFAAFLFLYGLLLFIGSF